MGVTVPSLITRQMCLEVIDEIMPPIVQLVKKPRGLLVALNPTIPYEPKYNGGPSNPKFLEDLPFFLCPFGNPEEWRLPYALVGLAKSYTVMKGGEDSDRILPGQYEAGMSPFKGGVRGVCGASLAFSGHTEVEDYQISKWFDEALYEKACAAVNGLPNEAKRCLTAPEDDLSLQDVADILGYNLQALLRPVYDHFGLEQPEPASVAAGD